MTARKKAVKTETVLTPEPGPARQPDTEITIVKKKVGWLESEIRRIEDMIPLPPVFKSWYTSPAVWLALILTLFALALVALFYLTESGYSIRLFGHVINRYGIK
jgi:hypothetical protein